MALARRVACSACRTGGEELSPPMIMAGEDFESSLIARLAEVVLVVVVVVAALFCRLAVRGGRELVLRQLPMLLLLDDDDDIRVGAYRLVHIRFISWTKIFFESVVLLP